VTFAEHLRSVLSAIETTLLEKNDRYGNSALDPIRIFSRADRSAGIAVRIDDKLSRIRNLGTAPSPDEDTVRDLLGYLVLWCVAEEEAKERSAKLVEAFDRVQVALDTFQGKLGADALHRAVDKTRVSIKKCGAEFFGDDLGLLHCTGASGHTGPHSSLSGVDQ